jgi:hypothetical protein
MRTIEIIVSPQGEALVETKGFAGSECQKASEFLQKALGQQTAERPAERRLVTMNTRRRILRTPRPLAASAPVDARRAKQLGRRRTRLAREQALLARWMTRLRRAFHAVERQQRKIARLERELTKNGQP